MTRGLIAPLGSAFTDAVGRLVRHSPVLDQPPSDLAGLVEANERYRKQRWPAPFDQTTHRLYGGDARNLDRIGDGTVHLIVTSPPYWTLKTYPKPRHSLVPSKITNSSWRLWIACGVSASACSFQVAGSAAWSVTYACPARGMGSITSFRSMRISRLDLAL